ncbi:MAG: CD3324 family protein [Defluviitaleaceae bacterium]|nr:CD3324 family protein [Defluviitaleaceae bacterium]
MRYVNAKDIFPEDVLALIQEYSDGAYIYVPRKAEKRKKWGESTGSKLETRERNAQIYAQYKSGNKVQELATSHFLSEKSIERIITLGRKQEQKE